MESLHPPELRRAEKAEGKVVYQVQRMACWYES